MLYNIYNLRVAVRSKLAMKGIADCGASAEWVGDILLLLHFNQNNQNTMEKTQWKIIGKT
jgi:hypothetical protein